MRATPAGVTTLEGKANPTSTRLQAPTLRRHKMPQGALLDDREVLFARSGGVMRISTCFR